jgi:hypothetical protein
MTMVARSGLAKGKNSGHITQQRELKPKPSHRKGVRHHHHHTPIENKPAGFLLSKKENKVYTSSIHFSHTPIVSSFLLILHHHHYRPKRQRKCKPKHQQQQQQQQQNRDSDWANARP